MTFASLFKPLEDFERLSDDEDYDDPALYELFKGIQMAKYLKRQKN